MLQFKFISAKLQSSIVFLTVVVVVVNILSSKLLGVSGETDEDSLLAPLRPLCRYNCTRPYSPLCGSDRKTYGNMCHLNTKNWCDNTNIRKVHDGTCRHQRCVPDMKPITCKCPCTIACLTVMNPVIGTNGITYTNDCVLASGTACLGYPVRVCRKVPLARASLEMGKGAGSMADE